MCTDESDLCAQMSPLPHTERIILFSKWFGSPRSQKDQHGYYPLASVLG